mgnify:CR=1 FL=1
MSDALKAKPAGEFSVLCPGEEGGAVKIKLGCLQNLLPRCPLLQLQRRGEVEGGEEKKVKQNRGRLCCLCCPLHCSGGGSGSNRLGGRSIGCAPVRLLLHGTGGGQC